MRLSRIVLSMGIVVLSAAVGRADPILFINDYEGFLEAAGDVQTIDFETLPDGSPTVGGEEITPEFNYTDQGVTFFSQAPRLIIAGNELTGFDLCACPLQSNDPDRNWIIGELVQPAWAVGYFFGGNSTLSVFDADGILVESVSFAGSGGGLFLGIVSDVWIASATADRGWNGESIDTFSFATVPEPTTVMLLTLGAVMVTCRRPRYIRVVGRR